MTGRWLRWGCRGAVLAWSLAALALARQPALEVAPRPTAVPLRPVAAWPRPVAQPESPEPVAEPEPPPEPRPAPAPSPPKAEPEPEPLSRAVGAAELAEGATLLDGGAFPALSFGYDDFPSFRSYARAMTALGARFVVVRDREIVASASPETGSIRAASVGRGFSPRARDYTGEPALSALAADARERFGGGAVVMMLVPRAVDAGLFGGISRILVERGEPRAGLREIRGSYQRGPAGGVLLRVDTAVRRDGTRVGLEAVFDLVQIAGART